MKTDTTRFVLPQLGVKKEDVINKYFIGAYIGSAEITSDDASILIKYCQPNDKIDKIASVSFTHNNDWVYQIDMGKLAKKSFYDKFLEGSYSKFTAFEKHNILTFWNLSKHSRMSNILYPEDYFFEIDSTRPVLYHKGEIWPKPNTLKETLSF